jgi:hypothetical protein
MPVPGQYLALPAATLCTNQSINDLSLYTGTTTGTFTGTGVSLNSGQYDFNITGTLTPGIYPVAFTYWDASCLNIIYQAVTVLNCCVAPGVGSFTVTSVSGSSLLAGPKFLPNSFTVTSGSSLFLNGELMISPNVKITVENNADLFITGAHLYGCATMWEGIEVLDGGQVVMQPYNSVDNMIEDAERAVKVWNNSSSGLVLDISYTVFNRNYIDIDLANCANATYSSFVIHSNVFTARQFTFSPTTWPQTSLSDLRSASGGTNVLYGPYELRSRPGATLKFPHAGEFSRTAIWLESVGATTGSYPSLTFNGCKIGQTPFGGSPENYFNLFDCHRNLSNPIIQA